MIFTTRVRLSVLVSVFVFNAISIPGFTQGVENSLFWQVSGKGLKEPSYLFGTFHLMGSEYIDSLTVVKEKFGMSKVVVGELILDNSLAPKIMQAAIMKDTLLQDLLSEQTYMETSLWIKELTGMDLKAFNSFNPTMVQMLIVTFIQQKLNGKPIVPMDLHFQNLARDSKELEGLETLEHQVEVMFGSASYREQARQLTEFVSEKDSSTQALLKMNHLYRNQDLNGLMEMFFDSGYSAGQQDALLDGRNKNWMGLLPGLFSKNSCFVAVGALHLPGEAGLIKLLRRAGYTVSPLPVR